MTSGGQQELVRKLKAREAKVGIIGMGYVGLPLALTFAERGFRVVGFDVDATKVARLSAGESYIRHIPSDRVRNAVGAGTLSATSDYERLSEPDCVIMCVPTPLTPAREPDMSYIEKSSQALAPRLRTGQLVVLESTTYPGTTEEVVRPILERGGLRAGKDYFLAYSPEREDPGNPRWSTERIPKVVGGTTPACLETAVALYSTALEKVVPVSSTQVAEMTKLFENIFRCVNIALVNELKMLCRRMNIDVWEVIDSAASKPFGFMPFYPGPGLGGHCIPIDPFYLTWKARQYEFSTRFIELAGEINTSMPHDVVGQVMQALSDRKKALSGARVLVLGLAYKKNVDDVRESPAMRVVELLRERGAEVAYHDPFVPHTHKMRHHDLGLSSRPLTDELIAAADCVLILTDHDGVDYERVVEKAQLVVDTRNATRKVTRGREKIVKA